MKKTQPIDWDKVKFVQDEYELAVKFSPKWSDWVFIPIDFIAAFDEMLENEIKNRVDKFPVVWDDVNGWKPLWIETGSHYYLNNA